MEVRIVGPTGRSTGGVSRYASEQATRLPADVSVTTHDVSPPSGTDGQVDLRGLFGAAVDAIRFVLRPPPDVVHVHTSHYLSFYRASFYVLFSALIWRRPVVLHVHGSSFDEFLSIDSQAVSLLQTIVLSTASEIVVLSPYWRDVLSMRTDEDAIRVLPNAVDPDEYDPQFDGDVPHIVFVSNLLERKGTAELIEAIDRLGRGTETRFRVSIAGDGPLSPLVEEWAAARPNVEYLGYVSEREKRELLAHGSIYVLPSHAEGLPIAILEGMAGGNAIVSTTVGSIPEVVGDENGILVEPGSPGELAAALESLVDAPERASEMARTNHELIRRSYSWDSVTDRLVEVYEHHA